MSSTWICDVSGRGRLRLTGEDRVRFLNGQVTNDVKALAPQTGCYAALTNAKGKMRADAVILNGDNALFLDLEPGLDARIASELDRFLVADDVTIENWTESWCAYTLAGENAAQILIESGVCKAPPSELFHMGRLSAPFEAGFVYRSRRAASASYDLWLERARRDDFQSQSAGPLQKLGLTVTDPSTLEIPRIEAGIPRFGVEMDETTLPPEAGIEAAAISYSKGCYLGQEIIARLKSVGHANRTLVRLRLPPAAERGQPLAWNGKEVGRLGSAVTSPQFGRIGLAIIRREAALPDTLLSLPGGEAAVVAEFAPLTLP